MNATKTEKLYVVVRTDLPAADQAVQSVHAALQYAAKHPDWTAWHASSNYIALLSVADEEELRSLLRKAVDVGLKTAAFREPDLDGSMTAVALEPGGLSGRICRKLRLALSEVRPAGS